MIIVHTNLYSLFFILGILVNLIFVYIETKKYGMQNVEIIGLLFLEAIGMIFGAKILYCIQTKTFNILSAGFSSYGALIGAIFTIWLFSLIFKKQNPQLYCITMLPMGLTYAIGKIGCFTAGCCYGVSYNGFMNVIYKKSTDAPLNVNLFPVQLLESFIFLIIFSAFYFFYKTHKFTIKNIYIYVFILSLLKGILYYLRQEATYNLFGSHQWICLVLCFLTVILIFKDKYTGGKISNAELSTRL